MHLRKIFKHFLFQWNWALRLHKQWNKLPFPSLDHLIGMFAKEHKDVFFIQIGANSMEYTDPLFGYIKLNKWKGLLVEPQLGLFKELQNKFNKNSNLILENFAISDQESQKPFYYLSPQSKNDKLPVWVNQLSSFHKEVPESVLHRLPNAKVDQANISCISLNKLLEKHAVDKLDLLVIDTEGHDYIILSGLDFKSYSPSLILYEHHFLDEEDDEKCLELLKKQDYFLYRDRFNTMAFSSLEIYNLYKPYLMRRSTSINL